ncbi:hypothetical protein EV361DRAFT_905332 [Lentinula raphanica]|nr:hypothetical protein EV361DRAFT_905332 [Lentinula raphanica]
MTRLIHVLPFGIILVLLASNISPGLLAAPTSFDRDELVLESNNDSRSARLFISLEQDLSRRNEASNDLTRTDINQGNHLHRNLPQSRKRPRILPRPDPDPIVCPFFRILSSLSSRTECPRYRHWRGQSKKWSIGFQKGCMLYQRIRRHRFYSLNSTRSTRRTQSPLRR